MYKRRLFFFIKKKTCTQVPFKTYIKQNHHARQTQTSRHMTEETKSHAFLHAFSDQTEIPNLVLVDYTGWRLISDTKRMPLVSVISQKGQVCWFNAFIVFMTEAVLMHGEVLVLVVP